VKRVRLLAKLRNLEADKALDISILCCSVHAQFKVRVGRAISRTDFLGSGVSFEDATRSIVLGHTEL
jgi:hypothetical protein